MFTWFVWFVCKFYKTTAISIVALTSIRIERNIKRKTGHISNFTNCERWRKKQSKIKYINLFSNSFLRIGSFVTQIFSHVCFFFDQFRGRKSFFVFAYYEFIQKSFILIIGSMASIHNLEIEVSFHLRALFYSYE